MADFKETAFNYIVGDKEGTFFSSETKWITKIERLAKERPNDVHIKYRNDDGSIIASVPIKYFKLSPPKQMSEENKRKASERFKKMHADKKSNIDKEN